MRSMHFFWTLLLCSFPFFEASARAGGGGRDSGGGSLASLAIAGVIYAIYQIRRHRMIAKAKEDHGRAVTKDKTWDEDLLKQVVTKTFFAYQEAWSRKDLESVRALLHQDYFLKSKRELETTLAGKTNVIRNPELDDLNLMSIRDVEGRDGDMFVMEVNAKMIDYTIRDSDGLFVESTLVWKKGEDYEAYKERAMSTAHNFREYWVFMRYESAWKLWSIKQSMSIVSDLKNMTAGDLRAVLEREKKSNAVSDDFFYKKAP